MWDDFDTNNREYFKGLRENQRLFDVTLATEDGQHIQAHKLILSAGSHFFNDIFRKCNQANMLIYLKGITNAHLEHVIDFIYNGEVFISEKELNQFLDTAKELQVKGLLGKLPGFQNKEKNEQNTFKSKDNEDGDSQDVFFYPVEDISKMEEYDTVKIEREHLSDNDLDIRIEEMIGEHEGLLKCKMCGKMSTRKQDIRRHAETHLEGMPHACQMCSKTFSTRNAFRQHKQRYHK